jgi:hypothetical protein
LLDAAVVDEVVELDELLEEVRRVLDVVDALGHVVSPCGDAAAAAVNPV